MSVTLSKRTGMAFDDGRFIPYFSGNKGLGGLIFVWHATWHIKLPAKKQVMLPTRCAYLWFVVENGLFGLPQQYVYTWLNAKVNVRFDFVCNVASEVGTNNTVPWLSIFFFKRSPNKCGNALIWFPLVLWVVEGSLSDIYCTVHHLVRHILRENDFLLLRHLQSISCRAISFVLVIVQEFCAFSFHGRASLMVVLHFTDWSELEASSARK